jgi:hypothetical protein
MSFSAWAMLVFAVVVLFGGLGVTIAIAIRVDRKKRGTGRRFDDD